MRQLVILAVGARQLVFSAVGARQMLFLTIDAPTSNPSSWCAPTGANFTSRRANWYFQQPGVAKFLDI
jgi:hypothetical protein